MNQDDKESIGNSSSEILNIPKLNSVNINLLRSNLYAKDVEDRSSSPGDTSNSMKEDNQNNQNLMNQYDGLETTDEMWRPW